MKLHLILKKINNKNSLVIQLVKHNIDDILMKRILYKTERINWKHVYQIMIH